MAKLKKATRTKSAAPKSNAAELQARAEHLSRSLVESVLPPHPDVCVHGGATLYG